MADGQSISGKRLLTPVQRNVLLLAMIIIVLVGVAVYANVWKSDSRINDVVVEGNKIVTTKEVLSLAKVPHKSLLFQLDLFAVEQRLLKNDFIKAAAIHRDIPDRIRITIEERVPVAAIVADRVYYVDENGIVLPPAQSPHIFDLPVITGAISPRELIGGRKLRNMNVLDAISVLVVSRAIDEDMYRNISEIHIDGSKDFVLYTSEYGIPVLLGRTQIGQKLVKFNSFWKAVVIHRGAQELHNVDLRFEDQVVVRWNHNDGDVHS